VRAEAYVEEALRWPATGDTSVPQSAENIIITPQPSEGGRILLADDNADMRSYVSRLLASRFEVQAVADGQAAIEAIRDSKPDLVLADVMMPRLDGIGLVRAIRANSALADLPVILLSARADEQARLEGLSAGADDYLTKPFNAHELLARVSANLKLAQMRQEATRDFVPLFLKLVEKGENEIPIEIIKCQRRRLLPQTGRGEEDQHTQGVAIAGKGGGGGVALLGQSASEIGLQERGQKEVLTHAAPPSRKARSAAMARRSNEPVR
jgi:DNA-binding response OmpR family regulator